MTEPAEKENAISVSLSIYPSRHQYVMAEAQRRKLSFAAIVGEAIDLHRGQHSNPPSDSSTESTN